MTGLYSVVLTPPCKSTEGKKPGQLAVKDMWPIHRYQLFIWTGHKRDLLLRLHRTRICSKQPLVLVEIQPMLGPDRSRLVHSVGTRS